MRFEWNPGPGPVPADYEFELSEFKDMRWVLSPNFHKLVSRTADRSTSSYSLASAGLLNPGQAYYWRVRARSQDEVWGPWSKTFSFSAVAPAVPVNATATFNRERRIAMLAWQGGKGGTAPVRFLIYGSEERGFSANDKPYESNAGLEGIRTQPANLLLETRDASSSVQIPEELWRPYYRIVAVDQEGRKSGVSDIATLSHPLIATTNLPPATAQQFYQVRIKTNASIGHLVSADEDGKSYQLRYRAGDDLVFELSGAPPGLSIDSTGLISGFVQAGKNEHYELTVEVKGNASGVGDTVKFPLSVAR